MQLPFTHQQFLEVFATYHRLFGPVALASWLATLGVLVLWWRRGPEASRVVASLLAFLWGWSGLAYHAALFRTINPAAGLFAVLFVVQAIVFLWSGVIRPRLVFTPSTRGWGVVGLALVAYAMIYPGMGLLAGLSLPAMPTFGLPCPTAILTAGLLLFVQPSSARIAAMIPTIAWSGIGGSAAFALGMRADLALPVAGALTLAFLLRAVPVAQARAGRPRAWRTGLLVLIVAMVVLASGWALSRRKAVEVETHLAAIGIVEDVVANSEGGTVRSRAQARIGAERAGRIEAIPRREGDAVRRGDLLLRLDTSTASRRLEAARRDLEALDAAHEVAHAAERLARQNLARTEPLQLQGLASAEKMDESRSRADGAAAELKAAEARLAGARAAVQLAEDELAHHIVRAPFDGVITRRFVEIGESVLPGQAVLEVLSPDRLYVSAPIDERDAARLEPALPARVTLDSYPGREWNAVVTRISPVVETEEEQNRTLEVEVDLRPSTALPIPRPGMTADVEIVLERRADVLRIPTLAIVEGGRVLVVERGRAVSRPVQVGLRNWQWTEVRSGLDGGERVITSLDRPGLRAGAEVRVAPASAKGDAAPQATNAESTP